MKLIKEMSLRNYRNIRNSVLKNLKDLNILIGPNNCGKSNLLKAVEIISSLGYGDYPLICKECDSKRPEEVLSAGINVSQEDMYMKKDRIQVKVRFNKIEIENMAPKSLEERKNLLEYYKCHCCETLSLKQRNHKLLCEHFTPLTHKTIIEELSKSVLTIPEIRLYTYKGKNISEYIAGKGLTSANLKRLEKFLDDLVDSRIVDHNPYNMDITIRKGGEELTMPLHKQGSGIRAIACLLADILSDEKARIVLIDEPELGLNPSSKYKLLEYLLELSDTRQIFLATQDHTFANPVYWKDDKVSVYLYSVSDEKFVHLNLTENKEDPGIFAGYLPHTTSLKNIHLYVEGSLDVYIFQIFLLKYLSEKYERWWKLYNQIGIYHLGGSFWKHLLYLIPNIPCRLVVLDSNEEEDREKILRDYREMKLEHMPSFKVCDSAEEIKGTLSEGEYCPVYYLKEPAIEEYLDPKPEDKNKGPEIAYEMKIVPEEIRKIFEVFVEGSKIQMKKKDHQVNQVKDL